jgi:hypothetical protein
MCLFSSSVLIARQVGGGIAALALARHCGSSHEVTVIDENWRTESRSGPLGFRFGPWTGLISQMYSESGEAFEQDPDRLLCAIKVHRVKVFEGLEEIATHPVPGKMISMSTFAAVHTRLHSIVKSRKDISVVKAKVTGKRDKVNGNWEITYEMNGTSVTKETDILVLTGGAYAGDRSHLREYRVTPTMLEGMLVWHGLLPVAWKDRAETTPGYLKTIAPGTLVRVLMGTPNHSIVL